MSLLNCQPANQKQAPDQPPPFESIYAQYHMRVYSYFRAHLKNEEDAADLTQQVFFQVWMHLSGYQAGRGSFATWLFSIAHHRLIDFLRALRPSASWETLSDIAIVGLNPEEIVIATESIERVRQLLDRLSRQERELLALRFAARLTIPEIALIIGKSEEATKKQLARLLRRLHKRYCSQEEFRYTNRQGQQAPAFLLVLTKIYTVSPPMSRATALALSSISTMKGYKQCSQAKIHMTSVQLNTHK
ncbi:sigma-70 family RNA polymerase sigma factor [Ktedonosporobacter rubrisoli]|uniref:Sigma-70 family RNA polymerase sigma factor n=1 Tax=Ktedonosporobacter rubrisoli TaxID=2509675 RepID=A0A4P6JLV5_KTERU|nr:sigma-70 family RNA polymerase sigma factor [Ktedonosporobacter rubrisoli]QBD76247.1 sigma-70 family RNA polymerase sigma factor [Ktedonosporobacter rubrisoli]